MYLCYRLFCLTLRRPQRSTLFPYTTLFRSVDVQVAEQRVLPAAERVVRNGYGDGDVHADHPGLHLELELTRDAAVSRKDRGAVPVWILVDESHGFLIRVDARDAEYGAEDLVVVGFRARLDVVEKRRREEEAAAVRRAVATVDDD